MEHHLIALWASQHTNVMHDWLSDLWRPPVKNGWVVLRTVGIGVTLGPAESDVWNVGFGKWEKKSHCLNLIIFYWLIEHPLISIHFEAGPFSVKVFSRSLSVFSLACSLHFIINWHKPFFEVQEPKLRNDSTTNNEQNTKRQWTLFEYSSEPP